MDNFDVIHVENAEIVENAESAEKVSEMPIIEISKSSDH